MCTVINNVHPANSMHKALEHYEDLADIKRAIVHTTTLQPDVSILILSWSCTVLTRL
jgi:hypothetical protein